ncbi:hypothetical protein [Paenibacillus psychroresistens]|nr:hypothetical protein [Paenibacillus psychroresistens]
MIIEKVDCNVCDGRGHIHSSFNEGDLECWNCDGKGEVRSEEYEKEN